MKQKAITLILTVIAALAPLLIIPDSNNYNILKFILLIVAGTALLILLLASYKTLKIDKKDVIILIFLSLIFISTFFSSNIKKSIIGEENRYEGLLMFVTYICIYLSSKKYFKYRKITLFFNIMFYVSIIIGILGVLQRHINYSNLNPIFNKNICSTFGNSNFFGSYISIILPISMCFFILYGNKKGFILATIMFFNMISSGTRSAWVAFGIVGLMGIIYLIQQRNKKYFKRALILIIVFILICIYLLNIYNIIIKFNKLNYKLAEVKIKQMKDDLKQLKKIREKNEIGVSNRIGSGRIEIWRMTVKLIKNKPIFGCGTDNLEKGLMQECKKDLYNYAVSTGVIVDKAHNEYLHIAATTGIPSLIIYLVFISLILLPKIKEVFKDNKSFIFSLAIISYLAQAFFNISTIGVAPLFWMILGLSDNEEIIIKESKD